MRSIFFIVLMISAVYSISVGESWGSFEDVQIFEKKINASIECVRNIFRQGLPEFKFPSFEPLYVKNLEYDLSEVKLPGLSGFIHVRNQLCAGISNWVISNLKGMFVLVPPTFTVNFLMHYERIYCTVEYYKFKVTYEDKSVWGEGDLLSGVENLNATGHVKAIVAPNNLTLLELDAPITVQTTNFSLTGFLNDEKLSAQITRFVNEDLPNLVNSNPQIFREVIGPIILSIFNALVHGDFGVGIVKTFSKRCILDIIYPPE